MQAHEQLSGGITGPSNILDASVMLKTIGVVGAGTMGRGIIQTIAARGIAVLFIERSSVACDRALADLAEELDHEIDRWSLTSAEKRAILARVEGTSDPARLAEADLAIECIDENPERKRAIFETIDDTLPPGRLILSNTSTISITELATATRRPALIAGLHFLYPAWRRAVVEIVRGLHTSDEAMATTRRFVEQLGKTAVEVVEYPGYITTRAIVPYLNEAMHMLMEGIASAEDIDTAMKLGYDFPSGPLSLADRMGLDEVMAWMEQLFRDLGDLKYRPCPLLRQLVRAGRLGVKTHAGFFEYGEDDKRLGSATQAAVLLPKAEQG